jgi:hypothetical protein
MNDNFEELNYRIGDCYDDNNAMYVRNLIRLTGNVSSKNEKIKVIAFLFDMIELELLYKEAFAIVVINKIVEFKKDDIAKNDESFMESLENMEKKILYVWVGP